MVDPVFIKTEFTDGSISGYDYGSQVRVVLRSPTAILFTGRGFNIWNPRGSTHHTSVYHLSHERPNKADLAKPEVVAKIDEVFGEGAGALAMQAWVSKGSGTCLIDGGGAPMPLTRVAARAKRDAEYAQVNVNWNADLTGRIKTCKQCGKALTPATDKHQYGWPIREDHPRTVEDCQRLTNHPVIAVHDFGVGYPDRDGFVSWFETWNFESYLDEDFCYGSDCAADYGRRAARQLPLLEPGGEVPRTPHYKADYRDHNPSPPRTFKMRDGSTIKA